MTLSSMRVATPVRIGIIGGGQLGKMIAEQANRLSFHVVILDPSADCPASVEASAQIVADFKDDNAILELAKKCDVITYEIELASSGALMELESKGFPVYPSPMILSVIQNKFKQKSFLKAHGIPVPKFAKVDSKDHLRELCKQFGFPVMLKASEDSYDGRGNFLIKSENLIEEAYSYFSGRESMVEEFVPFLMEVSVMVARSKSGQVESFPVVENIHKDGILDITLAPAKLSSKLELKAKSLARKVIKTFNGIGIFGVEMFVTRNGRLMVNEIAPRPHNSGHYSNEACSVSQFEQHVRAVLDLPLGRPELLSPSVMANILGPDKLSGKYRIEGMDKALSVTGARLYIYGKKTSQPRRKLGHITATANSRDMASARALRCRKLLKVLQDDGEEVIF